MRSRIKYGLKVNTFNWFASIRPVMALLAIIFVTNGVWAGERRGPQRSAKLLKPSPNSPLYESSSQPMPLLTADDLSSRNGEANIIAITWGETDPSLPNLNSRILVRLRDDPAEIAALLKTLPEGKRVLNPREFCWGLLNDPRDVCITPNGYPTNSRGIWPKRGLKDVRKNFDRFFSQLKTAGGEVDFVILDYEVGYQWPSIREGGVRRIAAIQNDPRFQPIARQLGFTELSEIEGEIENRLRWDAVMEGWRVKYKNKAITDVIHQYFPEAVISNYNSFLIDEENAVPRYSGRMEYRLGEGFGTHDAAKFYGIIKPGLARKRLDGNQPFGDKPFAGVLLYVNRLRAIRRSSDRPFQPWIVGYNHTQSALYPARKMVISKSRHYDDFVFQMGVHGCREIISWNLKSSVTGAAGTFSKPSDDVRLDNLIREMNQKLAGQWGKTVTLEQIPWGSRIIATGLHVDDRIVWRLTVDKGISVVVVKVNGQVQHLEREPNRRGLWFEHPADQSFEILRLE